MRDGDDVQTAFDEQCDSADRSRNSHQPKSSHDPRAHNLLHRLFISASAETAALAARVALAPRLHTFAIGAFASFATATVDANATILCGGSCLDVA